MNPGTMAPEAIDLGQITADTQLLGDATSRRFLSGLWELEGCALPVMPTVALELPGNVRGAENRRWQRTIRRDLARTNVRYKPGTYNAILRATREAAEAWTKEELERPDGVVAVQGSVETDAAAAALARALPAICFRSTNEENERNDRAIVAEAVVHGFTLLASENLRSIAHEQLNDWLQDQGKTRRPLIVQIHEALTAYRRDPAERARMAFRAVLGAALPAAEQGLERDVEAVERFIMALKRTHAERCGWWADDGRKATQDIPAAIRGARANLPVHTRTAEDRRRTATVVAARRAGYEGR